MIVNVVVDANIGAGKTTLLNWLREKLITTETIAYNFFEENVESWMNEGWLQKYYSKIPRYASSFQTRVLLSHIQQRKLIDEINRNQNQEIIVNICERSAITTVNIFSKMLVDDGMLDQMEMDMHNQILEIFNYQKPDLLIYLETDPELAFERLKKRSRNGEINITLEYLKKLNQIYNQEKENLAKKIITIDGSQGEENIANICIEYFNEYV